jgi:hypothetical protein
VHPGVVPPTTGGPNDLWTLDFKGQFRTRDGVYCYPLTFADQHTRFLLACRGLPSTRGQPARGVLERAFREFGLPRAIRTDNGVPVATRGVHGLSRLNVWWLRLGIASVGRPRAAPALDRPPAVRVPKHARRIGLSYSFNAQAKPRSRPRWARAAAAGGGPASSASASR